MGVMNMLSVAGSWAVFAACRTLDAQPGALLSGVCC